MTERVHDPNRGIDYAFAREGENLIVQVWAAPGADIPAHFHPAAEERWSVLDGELRFKVDGKTLTVTPEDGPVVVPPGVKHSMKNKSGRGTVSRVEVSPESGIQGFLEDFAEASREGLYNRRGMPRGLKAAKRLAGLVEQHSGATVVCWPPPAFQRLMRPLVGRR